MNQKVAIGIVVVLALLAGGYLWYMNRDIPAISEPLGPAPTENVSESPTVTQIANSIEGNWRSTDDTRFTRSFNGNGQVVDRYEGDENATVAGHYEVNGDHIPAQVRELAGDYPILSIEYPEEALFFIVRTLSATELELVYLGVGNTLSFTRF